MQETIRTGPGHVSWDEDLPNAPGILLQNQEIRDKKVRSYSGGNGNKTTHRAADDWVSGKGKFTLTDAGTLTRKVAFRPPTLAAKLWQRWGEFHSGRDWTKWEQAQGWSGARSDRAVECVQR